MVVLAVVAVATLMRFAGGPGTVSDADRAANAKTATNAMDFNTVCKDGSVRNAAPYSAPYKVVAFQQGPSPLALDDGHMWWTQVTLDRRSGIYHTDDPVTSISAVACLTRQKGSEVRAGSCDFDSDGDTVTAERYAAKWDVELREAKTGKSIATLAPVNGPATDCPVLATVDHNDPKIYADPDTFALTNELADFAKK